MSKLDIKLNDKFGSLTTIDEVERIKLPSGQYNRAFLCKCDCGNEKIIRLSHLIRGRIKTGGNCNQTNDLGNAKLYRVWRSMKERCYLSSYIRAERYSQRGIKVCDKWLESVENYIEDMGFPPFKEAQIDRINNDLGYSKENCRWATPKENSMNKRNNKSTVI